MGCHAMQDTGKHAVQLERDSATPNSKTPGKLSQRHRDKLSQIIAAQLHRFRNPQKPSESRWWHVREKIMKRAFKDSDSSSSDDNYPQEKSNRAAQREFYDALWRL